MKGIYGYYDTLKEKIIYIGKDSNINRQKRHKAHFKPSNYDEQKINRVLQRNPTRYQYVPLCILPKDATTDDLNKIETKHIAHLNPMFNFTKGGEGLVGFKFSEESKQKISNSLKGNKMSQDTNMKHSKTITTTGIYRVYIRKNKKLNKGYYWEYSWFDGDKRKYISRTNLSELKKEVLAKGLVWKILDETKFKKLTGKYLDMNDKPYSKKRTGLNASHTKYTLWDVTKTHYTKSLMLKNGRQPNPVRCFRVKWNNKGINIGNFMDFLSVELIYNLMNDAINNKEVSNEV